MYLYVLKLFVIRLFLQATDFNFDLDALTFSKNHNFYLFILKKGEAHLKKKFVLL